MHPPHAPHSFSNRLTPSTGAFLANLTLFNPPEPGINPTDATIPFTKASSPNIPTTPAYYRGTRVGVYTAGVVHDATVLGELPGLA